MPTNDMFIPTMATWCAGIYEGGRNWPKLIVAQNTDVVLAFGQVLPIMHTSAITATGNLVAAVVGKRIRLLGLWCTGIDANNATVNVTSGSGGATIVRANGGNQATPSLIYPFSAGGWGDTAAGSALYCTITGNATVKAIYVVEA